MNPGQNLIGFDRQTVSTPFTISRGSRATVKRTVYGYNPDSALEQAVDISSGQVTAIVWTLVPNLGKDVAAVLSKTLAASEISLPNTGTDGVYLFAFDDSDTASLALGTYFGQLAIVSGGNRFKSQPYEVTVAAAANAGE